MDRNTASLFVLLFCLRVLVQGSCSPPCASPYVCGDNGQCMIYHCCPPKSGHVQGLSIYNLASGKCDAGGQGIYPDINNYGTNDWMTCCYGSAANQCQTCTYNPKGTMEYGESGFCLNANISTTNDPNCCPCYPATTCLGDWNCGTMSDGCGGTVSCGTCSSGSTCVIDSDASGPEYEYHQAGHCVCKPATCSSLGAACGSVSDNCGGTLNCGTCTAPDTCVSNQCVCQPTTCSALGLSCGSASDGCGGALNCGGCPLLESCVSGKCELLCVPITIVTNFQPSTSQVTNLTQCVDNALGPVASVDITTESTTQEEGVWVTKQQLCCSSALLAANVASTVAQWVTSLPSSLSHCVPPVASMSAPSSKLLRQQQRRFNSQATTAEKLQQPAVEIAIFGAVGVAGTIAIIVGIAVALRQMRRSSYEGLNSATNDIEIPSPTC